MTIRVENDAWTYLDACPVCGDPVLEPLVRGNVQPVIHRGGRASNRQYIRPCRFVVDVAAEGEHHVLRVIEPTETLEDGLAELLSRPERIRRHFQHAYHQVAGLLEEAEAG